MPKWPFLFKDRVTLQTLRLIGEVRKSGATSLDLSYLQLSTLPEAIGRLSQLKGLNLSNNQLSTLPEAIGRLSQLKGLNLSNNQLSTLPEAIGRLSQLQKLGFSNNQLSTLPEAIGRLSQLKELNLSGNQLSTLPEAIGWLSQLKELNLSGNQLSTLPEAIGRLSQLKELYLSGNQLSTLPGAVQSLERLEALFLHRNPGLGLPDEVLGPTLREVLVAKLTRLPKTPREILDYYFATRGTQGRALREVKLIVVGRGGAGKTSLIKRLKGEPFDPREGETHGINIRELVLVCTDGPVQARVWDFGGQHVLYAMHEFFLTARSLYLLVLGERDDMAERDAAYWLQLIRSYAGPAPVVVALNKSGGREREMDRHTLEEKCGPILAWAPTECSESNPTKSGIEALRAALAKATGGMEEVRQRFPAKWFEIKNWLGGMKDSYIDYNDYAARCAELDERDSVKQEELAAWLHDLGVALNYGRDPRLRDTTVLRPDWLANGIYAVLRANDTRHEKPLAQDGIVTPESLGRIYSAAEKLEMLKTKDYPQEKWPFVLRLMSLFQLSFPLDEAGQRQLVPALLPVEEPSAATEPYGEGRVRLRYEFNVVPAPLVPRLLVWTFGLIKNALHWRRGALLFYGPATAKVWATPDERWVYATISGSQEARDDLTTILRETLRALFAEYKSLSVVEQMEWDGDWVPRATLEKQGLIPVAEITEVAALNFTGTGETGMTPGVAKPSGSRGSDPPEPPGPKVRLFVSYSHQNAAWCQRLLPVLRVQANVEGVQPWHDTELKAGDRWDKEIQAELEQMHIFLCLVSYHFLDSGYIQKVELPMAKARHENGEIEVVPVLLYRMDDLENECEFLYRFNPLPQWGKSWRDFEKDGDWQDGLFFIGKGVKQAIEKARLRCATC
jgi:internalin A